VSDVYTFCCHYIAESFGTLLQNYTPGSSLSARSIDDVLAGLPETTTGRERVVSPPKSPLNEVIIVCYLKFGF